MLMVVKPETALAKVIAIVGSQTAVAKRLGISSTAITRWPRAPERYIRRLSAMTGGVITKAQLRGN